MPSEEVASSLELSSAPVLPGREAPPVERVEMARVDAELLDTMLNKVADYFEREVDDTVDALSSMLEPLIMVLLGGIIGSIVVAIYLPIFKLGQVV